MAEQMSKPELARVLADGVDSSGKSVDVEAKRQLVCEALDSAGTAMDQRLGVMKELSTLAPYDSKEERRYLEFSSPYAYRDSFALSSNSAEGATGHELVSESYKEDGTVDKTSCKPRDGYIS